MNFIMEATKVEFHHESHESGILLKTSAEVKIQRSIFQGDALSPLLFWTSMMLLSYKLKKCNGGYKFTKSQEKITPFMYTYIKLFAKKEKELETIRLHCQWYRSGV